MNKKNYILNNADTRYFEYFFLRRLRYGKSIVVHIDEEGTDYSVTMPKDASFDAIKLKGNIEQTETPTPETPATIKTVSGDQVIKINKTNYNVSLNNDILNVSSEYTVSSSDIFKTVPISAKSGQTYTVRCDNIVTNGSGNCRVGFNDAGGVNVGTVWLSNTNKSATVKITGDAVSVYIYSDTNYAASQSVTTTFTDLEITEPIELCKIGNYQDYIYKDGDDWYVHKELGEVDLSTLTWDENKYNNCYIRRNTVIPNIKYVPNNTTLGVGLAEKYILRIGSGGSGNDAINHIMIDVNAVAVNTGTVANTPVTGLFYYQLATPTNTKITDSTLISQLNALFASGLKSGTNTIKVTAPSGLLPTIFNIIINH